MFSQMAVSWAIARHNRGMGEFEELILAAVPSIEALIPADPAAELGRYEPRQWSGHPQYGTPAQRALDDFSGLTAERLLGALELGVAGLTLTAPADTVAGLRPIPDGSRFSLMSHVGQSALKTPVTMVAAVHPGAIKLITERVRATTALLDLSDVTGDEAAVAARHGAAHLALAVATTTAMLRAIGTPTSTDPPAISGGAIGVTALLLPSIPKPPAYAQALLQRRRDEYKGRSWSASVPVSGHRFMSVEEPSHSWADFAAAAVTVVIGLDVDDVVDDFDRDSVAVEIDGGVVVVEEKNFVGTSRDVLESLSRNGKAASFFWNVNALTRLSFARDGTLISSEEPWEEAEFGDWRHRRDRDPAQYVGSWRLFTTSAKSSPGAPPRSWLRSAMSWLAVTYGRRISS